MAVLLPPPARLHKPFYHPTPKSAQGVLVQTGGRRLAAIMYTDMVGYTALTQQNEALAMQLLEEHRRLVRPVIAKYEGKEIKTMGDAFLIEFPSALQAVRCAYEIQRLLHEENANRPEDRKLVIRTGIHIGDVIHSQNDVYGDAVNIASRIYPLAAPGGICLTEQVQAQIKNKFELPLHSVGKRDLKNVVEPVEVYTVKLPWSGAGPAEELALDKRRVAILPMTNISPDASDAYLADGMTEELITALSGLSGLTVIARASMMKYKNTGKTVAEIKRELKVGTLIEGSVLKLGNRVRIAVQLVDAQSEGDIWAQRYDRDIVDIFAIQSEIASQVAQSLRVMVLPNEKERIQKAPTDNTDAYTQYLRGCLYSHLNKRGLEDVKKAAECFESAVKMDPSFSLGYVGLSDCYEVISANFGVSPAEYHEKARAMAEKALELDPGLAEAHASRGSVVEYDFNLQEAEKEFEKAIELKPGYAPAHLRYSRLLLARLKWEEALDQMEVALELDPLSLMINQNYALIYVLKGDYVKALELYKRAEELSPDYFFTHFALAWTYGKMKRFDDERREAKIGVELAKGIDPHVGTAFDVVMAVMEGDRQTVERLLPELEKNVGGIYSDAAWIADLHFYLGEHDEGFAWLGRAYSSKDSTLIHIKTDEFLDCVHSDPRYLDLLGRLGLE
jgi:TolB-like protein/class 3 adenylate cyclase